MWLGSNRQLSQITSVILLQSAIVRVSESARDLGIVLDYKLTMSEHVSALCRSGFYHLRQLWPVTRSLTPAAAQTVVQAFISCRLDHCNSLLYSSSENLMRRVQSVQNAAARLLTGARRRDHISPVLRRPHWLPVRRRIDFKLAPCSFVTGQAPHYLAEDIHLVAAGPGRQLRSSTDRSCSVPRTYSTSGDRSFAAAGTRVWDHLPSNLRDEKLSFRSFRRLLKTLVYCWPQRNVNNYLLRYRNTLTYLLTYLLTHMSRSRLRHVKEHSAYRQAYM